MEIKPPSNYVMANIDVKNGEWIKIMDEGEYRTLPQNPSKEVLTFLVEIPSGDEKMLTMNATSQTRCLQAWGKDSKKWVKKQCVVEIVKQNVMGKMKDVIYLTPETTAPVSEEKLPEEEIEE